MSNQINLATAMQLFDTQVTLKYQNSQKLMDTIDERHGTTGTTLNVPVSDLIEMQQGDFAPVDLPITPVNETNIQVITSDYHLKTCIGGGEKTLFNFDKITDHAKLHALAGARLTDYIKINAIFSNSGVGSIFTVDSTVGVNTGINEGKMAAALGYLESQGMDVTDYNVSMWAAAILKQGMYNDDRIVNFFYNDVKPLTNNRIQSYLDVDCRFLGSNGINSMPFTAGTPDVYLIPLVHRDAIVQSFNRDLQTSITWVPQQDRWELLTILTSGASVIQLNGIAFMECNNPYAANA
jgi:hypothetical protein